MVPVVIDVQGVEIEPNDCPLEKELNLKLTINASQKVPNAQWTVNYLVDTVHARKIISPFKNDMERNYAIIRTNMGLGHESMQRMFTEVWYAATNTLARMRIGNGDFGSMIREKRKVVTVVVVRVTIRKAHDAE
ncbi:hypothetical protein Pmar_PMAR000086 [Perkinsus marinus ATCC 50983]|uniref:Uncharacterized protein n=1 Tax=Perkinsus marinus (strain ATCC 50983 / TXsc) TaxID=423536 RepID=C5KPV2_PERM5|nr:hypothetical protein Pmar_PMAR000086 [Perkinsus marinus ATCC 50983]EER13499.1 hypothetical protein Pmar_PMAR000086 [Perkinsus marinus ATCC 50983]|eukprot:XP_002781704.1 hypothetical protein Pmar_PMAR000086 [Perkinsus marinus ATCC 50983]